MKYGTAGGMSSEQERREGDRQPIELRVEYTRVNAFFADYTKNISQGGTFIQTKNPVAVGTEFAFALYLPGEAEPIRLRGRVERVVEEGDPEGREAGMGVRFIYDGRGEQAALADAVRTLMTKNLGAYLTERVLQEEPGGTR